MVYLIDFSLAVIYINIVEERPDWKSILKKLKYQIF